MGIQRKKITPRGWGAVRLAAVAAVVFAVSYYWGRRVEPPPPRLDGADVAALCGATSRAEKSGRFWVLARGGEELYAAETTTYAGDIAGYGGRFNLLVVITADGVVDRAVVVRHNETASYMNDLPAFLRSFAGIKTSAAMEPGEDVDAMTRATVTGDAFALAVRITARRLYHDAAGGPVYATEKRREWDWFWGGVVAAFFAAGVLARRGPPEWTRLALYAAAVGILGFWGGRFISIGDVGRILVLKPPPFSANLALYVLLAGGLVTSLFFGNVYCGWACPFGALAEWVYRIPVRKLIVPPAYSRRLSWLRVAVLGVAVGVIVATREIGVAEYEPFDDLFAFAATRGPLVLLILILGVSIFHYRFFCRYLCAVGALWGEVAAAGRRRAAPASCRSCGECERACPLGAVDGNRGAVDAVLCVECGRCRLACSVEGDRG